MSLMKINPETGYPEIMPDTRIPPGGHTLGGIPGLQPRPLGLGQQLEELMRRPPPGSTEGGVSSFVGASSNDIQRMLNRGSVATGGVDDAQRQMEQVRTNEFLAKMRAQNPERFNNPTPPMRPMPPTPPGVDPGTLPRPPHPFLAEPQQFPFNPFLNKTTPSTAQPSDQGIMGQAPGFMTQYLDMMRSPMQGSMQNPMQSYGGGGMGGLSTNPMLQYQMPPNQSPMQTYGSQNNAPIQSPFA